MEFPSRIEHSLTTMCESQQALFYTEMLTMMATMIGRMKCVSLVSSVMITVSAMVMRATPAKKPAKEGV